MNLLADLKLWLVVILISSLGTVAALAPYYVGKKGVEAVLARFPQLKREQMHRVQSLYDDHGSGLLFFTFIPMLGVLLTAGAGVVGVQLSTFMTWVLIGRMTRNSILFVLLDQTLQLFVWR